MVRKHSGGNWDFNDDRDKSWTCRHCGRVYINLASDIPDAQRRHNLAFHSGQPEITTTPKFSTPFRRSPSSPSRYQYGTPKRHIRFHLPRPRISKAPIFLAMWVFVLIFGYVFVTRGFFLLAISSFLLSLFLFVGLFVMKRLLYGRIAAKIFFAFLVFLLLVGVYYNQQDLSMNYVVSAYNSTDNLLTSMSNSIQQTAQPTPSSPVTANGQSPPVVLETTTTSSQGGFSFPNLNLGGPTIDASWVSSFMSYVNQARQNAGAPALTHSSNLDQFSAQRFQTSTSGNNYEISHYGFDQDANSFFGNDYNVGEVVYYPSGYQASDYPSYLQTNAPGHWNLMMDSTLTQYGYYIGTGNTVEFEGSCSLTEIPGPNINVTQLAIQDGCTPITLSATWLIIDFHT